MKKITNLNDLPKKELIGLINSVHKCFEKSFVHYADTSVCLYFFNTKNSVNCYININKVLLNEYDMDIEKTLIEAQVK